MKNNKGLLIALLVVGTLLLAALVANLLQGGVWILEGLNGADGKDGVSGENGANGVDGVNGKSAYELAVEDGFQGSLHEWLLSLAVRGADGENGKNGVSGDGVSDVKVNAQGELLVTLTDGTVLNAGKVAAQGSENGGSFSGEVDEEGFLEVYEMVTQFKQYTLTLRETPQVDSNGYPIGKALYYIDKGTEILRIGVNEETGFSRLLYNGNPCYAYSSNFELKYIYEGELPEVHLPEQMVLTKGEKTWFMTDAIVKDLPSDMTVTYLYDGTGSCVSNGDRSFCVTPTAVGNATLTLSLGKYDSGEWRTVFRQTVNITVVEKNTAASLTGMFIGDSRVSDGAMVDMLYEKMPNLTLLGTLKSAGDGVPHEGRGSWSTQHYMEDTEYAGRTNAFYNPATDSFDFSYYMSRNAPTAELDFVVICLGANDSFSKASVENLQTMVQSIQAYAQAKGRKIQVLVMTEYLSPADGYYLTTSGGTDVAKIRANQFRYFTYLNEAFGGREDEGIVLLPNYLCINDWSDWDKETVSTENGDEKKITDIVHLGPSGYRKQATMLMSYLFRMAES